MSEARKILDENARALGLSPTSPRASRPRLSEEERAARKAEREARKAKKERDATPILNLDAEVTEEDEAEAIASIQAKAHEAEALESIMRAMRGES